jgi:hypothetical protein
MDRELLHSRVRKRQCARVATGAGFADLFPANTGRRTRSKEPREPVNAPASWSPDPAAVATWAHGRNVNKGARGGYW